MSSTFLVFSLVTHPSLQVSQKSQADRMRPVSLLTPHCPRDHVQVVLSVPLSFITIYPLASAAPL